MAFPCNNLKIYKKSKAPLMKEYPKKLKKEAINQHISGVSVAKIAESLSIS